MQKERKQSLKEALPIKKDFANVYIQSYLIRDIIGFGCDWIEIVGGVMINKSTVIPYLDKKAQLFISLSESSNSVSIAILKGERAMAKDNRLLGQVEVTGIPPVPRDIPQIEVTFRAEINITSPLRKDVCRKKKSSE
ncbi:unnamed protein product [Albugo candida]|uniref:Uncharacterized protein n=1 Tax=Albugo candida TaxID=65357 RepID=A0A024GF75_9STRA|nr:unnamed protein product [Albugo candida]|eukprot:CCI45196.1 unnamed protein product [Albugo candida]